MALQPCAQGGSIGADLVEKSAQTCLAVLFQDHREQLVRGDAAAVARARRPQIRTVGASGMAVGEMVKPRLPVGSMEMRQMQLWHLDVAGVCLAFQKRIVDAEL